MSQFEKIEYETLKSKFNEVEVFTQVMEIEEVLKIFYVAVRGKDEEEGAVQRVLSKRRVSSIKEYILSGKEFFSTFLLNWTDDNYKPEILKNKIRIPVVPSAAQVIDGQHRLAGLNAASKIDSSILKKKILVSICIGLSTRQAAEIFLNINSEQKPVNRSLIYDLFGLTDEDDRNSHIIRATDLAKELNENPESPYYGMIKTPGMPRGQGFVDLSTVVNALKNYYKKGDFYKHKITGFDFQKTIFINYFNAIKYFYDKEKEGLWVSKTKNPFARNAGVVAGIHYFMEILIEKCKEKKSFTVSTFKDFLNLTPVMFADDIKGLGGLASQKKVREFLESNLIEQSPSQDEYEY